MSSHDQDFAYTDSTGHQHLPIHDEAHVRNAAARFSQTHFENAEAKRNAAHAIVRAAKTHRIELDDDDDVVKAASS